MDEEIGLVILISGLFLRIENVLNDYQNVLLCLISFILLVLLHIPSFSLLSYKIPSLIIQNALYSSF